MDLALNMAAMLFGAGAVYGAIRSDLKGLHEKLADAKETAVRAHRRLDDLMMMKGGGGGHG